MGLFNNDNGLRGGQPYYDMPQNIPLINWNGPTGLMTMLQFMPQSQVPTVKNSPGKLPNSMAGQLKGYSEKEKALIDATEQINNYVISKMPLYNNDFNEFQRNEPDVIKQVKDIQLEKQKLKQDFINDENTLKQYEQHVDMTRTNASGDNVLLINGQVVPKSIDANGNPDFYDPKKEGSKYAGFMKYSDYLTWLDNNYKSQSKPDFFTNIGALNKNKGFGQDAINSWLKSAASTFNGSKYSTEGDPSKIREITTSDIDPITKQPIDPNAYKMAYLMGGGSGVTSNFKNINDALGFFKDKNNPKGDYNIAPFWTTLTPVQQQDLWDDYLRMAEPYANKADLTVDFEKNKDFREYITRRMITTAVPLYSKKTESSQSYSLMPDSWNEKKKEQKEPLYWTNLKANTPVTTTGTVFTQNGMGNPQLNWAGDAKNPIPKKTWLAPDQVEGFNNRLALEAKRNNYEHLSQYGGSAFWFAGIPTPMKNLSNKTWILGATGYGSQQYLQRDYEGNVVPLYSESMMDKKKYNQYWSDKPGFVSGFVDPNVKSIINSIPMPVESNGETKWNIKNANLPFLNKTTLKSPPVNMGVSPLYTGGTVPGSGPVETIRVTIAMKPEDFKEVVDQWNGVKETNTGMIVTNGKSDLYKLKDKTIDKDLLKSYKAMLDQEKNKISIVKDVIRPDGTKGDIITIEVDNELNPNTSRLFENKTNSEYIRKLEYNQNMENFENESNKSNIQYKVADTYTVIQ